MKRSFTLSVLFLAFASNAFSASIHKIEVTPLVKAPLLESKDFATARVSGAGKKSILSIRLMDQAAHRLKEYTAENIGRQLPFVVDGKIIESPTIRVAIEGNAFEVEPMDRKTADEVAQFINTGNQ